MNIAPDLGTILLQDLGLGIGTYAARSVISPAFDRTRNFPATLGEVGEGASAALSVIVTNSLWEGLKMWLSKTGYDYKLPQGPWESFAGEAAVLFLGSAATYGLLGASFSDTKNVSDTFSEPDPYATGLYGTITLTLGCIVQTMLR